MAGESGDDDDDDDWQLLLLLQSVDFPLFDVGG
jgi:hypothetical protein